MAFRGPITSILPKKGIDNGDYDFNIDAQRSPDCRNVRFGDLGVEKRDGVSRYVDDAVDSEPVVGVAQLVLSSGTTYQVVQAGDKLVKEDASAWTSIKGGLTITSDPDNLVQFAQLTDLLIGTNDVDPLWKFSGTGNAAALGGVPTSFLCKAITDFKNYIMTLNTSESGVRRRGRIRWSDLNNAESWSAANYNDALNNTGQAGQGFGKVNDQLFAFFDRSIQEIVYTGDSISPFFFPTVSPEVGTTSGTGVVPVDDALFFPSFNGIYGMRGGGSPQLISGRIQGTWDTLNVTRLDKIVGVHNRRDTEVWFAVSTGSNTSHDRVLVYNYKTDEWYEFDSWNVNAFATFLGTQPLAPVLGNTTGRVMLTNTGVYLDDTSAIDAYVRTKVLPFGDPGRRGQVKRIQVICDADPTDGALLQISHAYGLNSIASPIGVSIAAGGAEWDSAVWDTATWAQEGLREAFYRPDGHGRMVQFEFRNAQASVGMKLSDVLAWVVGEQRSGGP